MPLPKTTFSLARHIYDKRENELEKRLALLGALAGAALLGAAAYRKAIPPTGHKLLYGLVGAGAGALGGGSLGRLIGKLFD